MYTAIVYPILLSVPMSTAHGMQRVDSTNPSKAARESNVSRDGKWKSFPRIPCLLMYIPSGTFFGRAKIAGKIIRQSLDTDVFTTAKLRLGDFLKDRRKRALRPVVGVFSEARASYEAALSADHALKEASKHYRRNCIKALLRTWPELDASSPAKITETDCRAWASRFATEYDEQFFNNTLSTLRQILERAGLGRDDNPAFKVKRLGVKPKELKLPEPAQFEALLHTIETAGARQSHHCADFVRFLAFSGCRLTEAREVTWLDVDLARQEIRVHTAKRAKTSGTATVRLVPIIPPMRELLERLKSANPPHHAPVCHVGECEKSLTRACRVLGIPRITHHDLRHLFATRCIESGVDIPTVARWLGHVDGGALAMKVYGHLRSQHSQEMATKVKF